jgi:heterodisulfide reductase subunit C
MPEAIQIDETASKLSDAVAAVGGIDVSYCYQCGKGSTGCPMAYEMDLKPSQLMHAIQLGLKDLVYNSKTMWMCASCHNCSAHCPQDVDIAEVMDTVKIMMLREKRTPKVPDVLKLSKCFVENLKWFGRMYELGMVGMLKLSTGKLTQDMAMGMKMFKKGKFNLLPGFTGAWAVRNIIKRVRKLEKS